MANIELISLTCASCGAGLDNFHDKDEVKCDFCNNVTRILRPIKVENYNSGLEKQELKRLENLINIMEKSMVAENYGEAYRYCNKALEINPDCAALWENKAICSFWLRTDHDIISTEAKEILTYLNAAKQADPDSPTYEPTAISISSNLFFAVYYRYLIKSFDDSTNNKTYNTWSLKARNIFINYMKIMELCFTIYPDIQYLIVAVEELTNLKKAFWIDVSKKGKLTDKPFLKQLGFNAVKTREKFINKIQSVEPSYKPPAFPKKKGYCFIATATMGDYDHPIVMDLRIFRDEWLANKKWGMKFISFYYKYGNIPAKVIERSIILRKISYILLIKPLHFICRKLSKD